MLNNIDLTAVMNDVNAWGQHYWGFILVVSVVSYFVTNFVHNVRTALRNAHERRLDRLTHLVKSGRPYMTTLNNNYVPRTNLGNVLMRSSDMEMVNAMDQARITRLNNMKGNASGGQ